MTCISPPSDTQDRKIAVCLVDDDEIMRDLLLRYLVKLGCEVTTAVEPNEALEKLVSQDFELVMTDLYMPGIEDGLSFISALKERHSTLRTVVMSAEMSQSTQDTLMSAGAFACMEKPISSKRLAEVLARVTASRTNG